MWVGDETEDSLMEEWEKGGRFTSKDGEAEDGECGEGGWMQKSRGTILSSFIARTREAVSIEIWLMDDSSPESFSSSLERSSSVCLTVSFLFLPSLEASTCFWDPIMLILTKFGCLAGKF